MQRQRTAKRTMVALVAVCVCAVALLASIQLLRTGWSTFVERGAGIGATADVADRADGADPPVADEQASSAPDPATTTTVVPRPRAPAATIPPPVARRSARPPRRRRPR
jgi:hypothetical protein